MLGLSCLAHGSRQPGPEGVQFKVTGLVQLGGERKEHFCWLCWRDKIRLVCVRAQWSRLSVTPRTVAHQAPWPWDVPGKNPRVWVAVLPPDRTQVSCIIRWFLYPVPPGKPRDTAY